MDIRAVILIRVLRLFGSRFFSLSRFCVICCCRSMLLDVDAACCVAPDRVRPDPGDHHHLDAVVVPHVRPRLQSVGEHVSANNPTHTASVRRKARGGCVWLRVCQIERAHGMGFFIVREMFVVTYFTLLYTTFLFYPVAVKRLFIKTRTRCGCAHWHGNPNESDPRVCF